MAIPNRESYPTPALQEKVIDTSGGRYITPAWVMEGWAPQATGVVEQIYSDFNEEHGTDYKF